MYIDKKRDDSIQLLMTHSLVVSVAGQFACPDDWITNGLHCYNYNDSRVTWTDAIDVCESMDSQLLIVEDYVEAAWIKSKC